ncbi:MAG: RHS repeat-associated core domain-containing protein, partial [Firmicutes bacterium]|nr:RHS repeat-associated core domain-containing protein [Bacillota bacterium]
DADSGLWYFNARWYDADTGRFISEDPMGDPNNPNLYSYCANNPLRFIDPTGLSHEKPYEGDPWEFEDPTSGGGTGGTGGSGTSGNGPTYTSPWVPTIPDFQAPNAWDQYQNYWKNFPTGYEWERELCNQAIMVLNSGMDLWGLQALTPNNVDLRSTINLRDWNITNGQALSVIKNVVRVTVDAMQRSERGFVELPFNTPKDRDGFKEYQIFGLKYGQYGDMSNTFYWGTPDFVEKIMVSALYWNYLNEDSRIAFNDLSYRNGGKTATHSSHRDGMDVDLKIQWWNSSTGRYDDLNKILPGKSGYNIYLKGNTFYQTFGKQKNREFIGMISAIYPNTFNEILWCDWTLRGVSPSIKTNAKLRYDHRHHIHLGF